MLITSLLTACAPRLAMDVITNRYVIDIHEDHADLGKKICFVKEVKGYNQGSRQILGGQDDRLKDYKYIPGYQYHIEDHDFVVTRKDVFKIIGVVDITAKGLAESFGGDSRFTIYLKDGEKYLASGGYYYETDKRCSAATGTSSTAITVDLHSKS
ncbi:MAG: hypothetical protein GKR92_05340 [Gammaproteobacteria bacterium]|nr:MAG: hypothetical protein GKR92_05340 [Gammaproteobacteria bacterium]